MSESAPGRSLQARTSSPATRAGRPVQTRELSHVGQLAKRLDALAESGTWARSVLLLGAAGVLVLSLSVPWYSYSYGAGSIATTVNLFAGPNMSYQVTICGTVCPVTSYSTEYAAAGFSATGRLYFAVQVAVVAAILAALAATAFSWISGPLRTKARGLPYVLAFAAGGIALLAPTLLLLAQPAAWTSDLAVRLGPYVSSAGSGPWTSFFGSCCSGTQTGEAGSWGPSAGWYASLAAGGLLLLAAWTSSHRFTSAAVGPREAGSDHPLLATDESTQRFGLVRCATCRKVFSTDWQACCPHCGASPMGDPIEWLPG